MAFFSRARLRNLLRNFVTELRGHYYRRVWNMDIGKGVRMSLTAKLDKTNPRGVHIGDYSHLTFRTTVMAHDFSRRLSTNTYIGSHCFIGCGAIIMPGVRIGDHCIIGSGSVVTKDIPSNSIAAGNPARVLKQGIMTEKLGILINPKGEVPSAPKE